MTLQKQDYYRMTQFQRKMAKTDESTEYAVYPDVVTDTLTDERVGQKHQFIYTKYKNLFSSVLIKIKNLKEISFSEKN